jgi:ABC-type uncharacterized transport system auxiliary subunit
MKPKFIEISLALTALIALIALSGCGAAVKYPKYYTLHVPPPPDPPALAGLHTTLAVREFSSPAYLRQEAIVYRASPEQIGFYNYHRWAIDPREFVTNAVVDHLRANGTFSQVRPYDGRTDTDYVLSGRLYKFEEVDYEGGIKVEVAISAQMVRLSTGATVWTDSVTEVGQVDKRDVSAVVSALSRTMELAISKLLTRGPGIASEQESKARRGADGK